MTRIVVFSVLASLFLVSCKKEEECGNCTSNVPGGGSNSAVFISFNDGGSSQQFTSGNQGYSNVKTTGGTTNTAANEKTVITTSSVQKIGEPYASVEFTNYVFSLGGYTEYDALASIMTNGSKPFYASSASTGGVVVRYFDGQTLWQSSSQTQPGSSNFSILTSNGLTPQNEVQASRQISGTFSCVVYAGANSKTLSSGSYRLTFDAP